MDNGCSAYGLSLGTVRWSLVCVCVCTCRRTVTIRSILSIPSNHHIVSIHFLEYPGKWTEKMRSNRPITFAADLNLHAFTENEIEPMMNGSRRCADQPECTKKQKILMDVSTSSSTPLLAKHRNGHGNRTDNCEDSNNIEWSWLTGGDGIENGYGEFGMWFCSL